MFTAEQIQQAHGKVRSGADFPAYISDLKQLGVTSYRTYVADGHTRFAGNGDHRVSTPAKYAAKEVSAACDAGGFRAALEAHQQGATDYPTFIDRCAVFGVEGWAVDLGAMTCTYFDKAGHEVLVEQIPEAR